MKSEGKICIAEAKILFDALQSGRDIITEEFDALLDKNQNSVLLMKNALNCALSHGGNVTSLAVCQIPDSTSVVRYMDEVISSLKESSDKKEVANTTSRSVQLNIANYIKSTLSGWPCACACQHPD